MITQVIDTTYQPRFTSSYLSASITERIKELAQATDEARMTEEMLQYLGTCAKFHQYSPCNVWCILMACPDATNVAGYQKWRTFNRYVRKGEQGIPILAPIFIQENPDDPTSRQELKGFRVVYVFDISQTEGEPLPEPPNWKSPQQNAILSQRLIEFAKQKSISVTIKKLEGNTQGLSRGGEIELDPSAGTKTLIHEIAHELLHQDENRPMDKTIRELEAESVAYVVGKHFGLDGLSSPNYVALHGATSEMILDHLERIGRAAAEIINKLENTGNINHFE
jgi:hypothetical protein